MRRDSDRTRSAGPLKSRGSGRGSHDCAHHSCKATLTGTRRRCRPIAELSPGDAHRPSCTGAHSRSTWWRVATDAGNPSRAASRAVRRASSSTRAMPAMQVREDPVEHDLRVRPFPKGPWCRCDFRFGSIRCSAGAKNLARLPPGGCVSSGTRCRTRRRREWDCPRRRARGGTSRPWRSRRRGG